MKNHIFEVSMASFQNTQKSRVFLNIFWVN